MGLTPRPNASPSFAPPRASSASSSFGRTSWIALATTNLLAAGCTTAEFYTPRTLDAGEQLEVEATDVAPIDSAPWQVTPDGLAPEPVGADDQTRYDATPATTDVTNLVGCDARRVTCTQPAPPCHVGQVPSVLDGCYGPCVPIVECSCTTADECPTSKMTSTSGEPRVLEYTCYRAGHCGDLL